jgi:formamidopyrimidine-DNA glycosylase
MDQTVLAGLGNIQATEALFRARLHPATPASSLKHAKIAALVEGILRTIEHTLAAHARRGDDIVYVSDRTGAESPFLVYGRVGEPCPRCGASIASMTIAGRTSPYCPRCQRPTRSAPRRGRG